MTNKDLMAWLIEQRANAINQRSFERMADRIDIDRMSELGARIDILTDEIETLRIEMLDPDELKMELEVSKRRMEAQKRRYAAEIARLPSLRAALEKIENTDWAVEHAKFRARLKAGV